MERGSSSYTTPGILSWEFMRPEIALVQAGAGMDVAGRGYDQFNDVEREAVISAFPRDEDFSAGSSMPSTKA